MRLKQAVTGVDDYFSSVASFFITFSNNSSSLGYILTIKIVASVDNFDDRSSIYYFGQYTGCLFHWYPPLKILSAKKLI